ncbi:hypothetical protein Tco_0980588 [Tanacetum coccineum]
MDDLNITMEEYIRLEVEKARRYGRNFNWETATYGKPESPRELTVIPIDELKLDSQGCHSELDIRIPSKDIPVNSLNDVINNNTNPNELEKDVTAHSMAQLPIRAQRHPWLEYEVEGNTEEVVQEFEHRLAGIFSRRVHRVQVLDFEGMTEKMGMDLVASLSIRHRDAKGLVVFTSHAWRRLFDIRGPLVRELMLEFFSTCSFDDMVLDFDADGVLSFQLGGARRTMSWRQFILAMGLHMTKEIDT